MQDGGDALGDLREKRVHQIRNDEPNAVRRPLTNARAARFGP